MRYKHINLFSFRRVLCFILLSTNLHFLVSVYGTISIIMILQGLKIITNDTASAQGIPACLKLLLHGDYYLIL